jgi:hypothetical protein
MDAATAARVINTEMHLMPGVRVEAIPYPMDYTNTKIILDFQIDSYETDDYWVNPHRVTVNPQGMADVSECSNLTDLTRVVFDGVMYQLAHEWREGIRVGEQMIAPLHPHNKGRERYARTQHLAKLAPIAA